MRLSELKDNFISNISHELKTPVSTVKVALEALQNLKLSKNETMMRDYLGMASLEMDRLEQLIGKVLNTFLLESGVHAMTLENTRMDELVNEVLESFRLRFFNEDASVTFQHPKESLSVNIDKLYIQGVLINLLDNSLKYANKKPEINIQLSALGDNIVLVISDNGPGIPNEYTDRVFEKFFRVPTGNMHNVKGHGLGLTYAAEIMKQHKGEIQIENLPAGGCSFRLIFQKAPV
jgi:K+-sensing histidine kinase KdpD